MEEKEFYIGDERVVLEEAAVNGNDKLYRFPMDDRIRTASKDEVSRRFPDYERPKDDWLYDYLIEEDGELVFYDEDGEPVKG